MDDRLFIKYSIVTFGCRVNQADSLQIESRLMAGGGVASSSGEADLVVVNTCSVTGSADQATRQIVRKISRDNPRARIVVTGCYATRRPDEVGALPGVMRVVPNDRKEQLFAELNLTTAGRFGDGDGPCGAPLGPGVSGRTAFTLRVQTGCDQACSYCIIPSTRGAGRSRPIAAVIAAIGGAVDAGYREVVLTGVHLGSYGRDLEDGSSLLELLRQIDRTFSEVRIRVSSLEPMDCTDGIVDLIAASDVLAPHFHLPLQHASDRVLAAMRRPYTSAYYRKLVERIRTNVPHASIGSDVIAGFPGETDADFACLESFLRDSPLTHLHVFPYSDRPGTEASQLPGKVHGAVIRERATGLRAAGRRLAEAFHARQDGSVRPALTLEDGSLAVTDNYLKVRLAPGSTRNERVIVRLSRAGDTFTGEVVRQL